MKFKEYTKLIERCNIVTKITGNEDYLHCKDHLVHACIQQLIENAADKLTSPVLGKPHLVSFHLTVYASEIDHEK